MRSIKTAWRRNAHVTRVLSTVLAASILFSTAVVFAEAGHAAETPAEESIGMSAEPLNELGATARSRFDYQIGPGQALDDTYVITNEGSTAQEFLIFATDAFNTDDGDFALLDTGIQPTDAGAWVTFGAERSVTRTLQPGESASVPFTVNPPADASPGDHAGGLIVSIQSPDGQVLVDRRLGTRLYVRVPGELQPNLTIDGVSASYAPSFNPLSGETTVSFTVRNAGNIALAGQLKTEVKGVFGIGLAAVVNQEVSEMLPGSTRTVTATVSGVGQWVFLNPVVTVYPEVEESALDPGLLSSISRDTVLFVVPWVLLAVIVIGLLIWAFVRFSRRRDDRRAKAWIEYTEAEARRKADIERETVGAAAGDPGGSQR